MIFLCFKINMLKKEEGGRRDTAKAEKNEKLFFQKYYIFLLILHINEEQEIPGRRKVIRGSNVQALTSYAEINLQSKAGNKGTSLSYQFILTSNQYGKTSNKAAKMPHKTDGISAIQNQIASNTRFAGYLFEALLRIETPPILRKLCNDLIRWKRKL